MSSDRTKLKKCNKCGLVKSEDDFHPDYRRDNLRPSCKKCLYQSRKEYNKEYLKEYRKKYNKTKKRIEYLRNYEKERYRKDPVFKMAIVLRHRIYTSLRRNKNIPAGDKKFSAVKDLGCSIVELKKYLEDKFQKGMTWDNHGEWHVDHIKPLISFDLTDRRQILKAIHYSNLQPLWAIDNQRKWKN